MKDQLLSIALIVIVSLVVSGCISDTTKTNTANNTSIEVNNSNISDNDSVDGNNITYINNRGNFTIQLLADWSVTEYPDGNYKATFYHPKNTSAGSCDGEINIYRTFSTDGPVDLAGAKTELYIYSYDWFRRSLISYSDTNVSNLPALETIYWGWFIDPISGNSSEKHKYLEIITVAGETPVFSGNNATLIYVITYQASEGTYDKYLDEARYMIDSFNITSHLWMPGSQDMQKYGLK